MKEKYLLLRNWDSEIWGHFPALLLWFCLIKLLNLSKAEFPALTTGMLLFLCLYQGESVMCSQGSVGAFTCSCDRNIKSWHPQCCGVAGMRFGVSVCDPGQAEDALVPSVAEHRQAETQTLLWSSSVRSLHHGTLHCSQFTFSTTSYTIRQLNGIS